MRNKPYCSGLLQTLILLHRYIIFRIKLVLYCWYFSLCGNGDSAPIYGLHEHVISHSCSWDVTCEQNQKALSTKYTELQSLYLTEWTNTRVSGVVWESASRCTWTKLLCTRKLCYIIIIIIIRKQLNYKICLDYVMYVCKRVTMPIPLVSIPINVLQWTQGLPSVRQSILILLS